MKINLLSGLDSFGIITWLKFIACLLTVKIWPQWGHQIGYILSHSKLIIWLCWLKNMKPYLFVRLKLRWDTFMSFYQTCFCRVICKRKLLSTIKTLGKPSSILKALFPTKLNSKFKAGRTRVLRWAWIFTWAYSGSIRGTNGQLRD